MPRLLDKPDRNFSANQTPYAIAELLLASPPLALEELFDDPKVRKRVWGFRSLGQMGRFSGPSVL